MTTALATGLLMLGVAQPMLTGDMAEAAQARTFRPAPRVMARPAPRMTARPIVARPKSTFAKPKATFKQAPKVVNTGPKFAPKPLQQKQLIPQAKKGFSNPQALKGNPNLGPGMQGKFKFGPSYGKKQLGHGPGMAPKQFNVLKLANKSWPIHKGPHKLWWKGGWKTFVPFTAIGVALIGGAYYYPDAYVSVARPYCSGITPDGCQLNWQEVPFEGGGAEWQCVQFCPRPNAIPPPQAVALVAPPPMPQGSCEVTIFSDMNFGGTGVTTGEEQPALSQSGWQNQIASIQVKSGTWDFFTDENFAGGTMRLQPGPYQDLGPEWTKKIGSFMCIQPGS
jgi:hypothetical protein